MTDSLLNADPNRPAVPVAALPSSELEAFLAGLPREQAAFARAVDFQAKSGTVALLPDREGRIALVLFGLGNGEGNGLIYGRLATAVPKGTYRLTARPARPDLAAIGFALGAYRFNRYRDAERSEVSLVMPDGADAAEVRRIVAGAILARDLINTPANDMGPADLAMAAQSVASRYGAAAFQLVGEDLKANNYPLIHAVGAAAANDRAPRLIDFAWGDAGHPKLTLVGKGVCFDTGGLDIKPSSNMLLMKKDMGGAANVLGLATMIMDAGLPVRLRVLIPAVENSISGRAFRPGDVFSSRKGLTVEIGNTDAEGRLILADALALACEEQPDLLIDLATLTGAARTATGPDVSPFYTRDDALAANVARHSEATADPLWRLPLWTPYFSLIESKVADINNAGSSGFAGSITAALFLSRFVSETTRWLHGDIFGWTPSAKPGKPEGGEAQAIRALYALIKERYPR
ncbi:MAG: leucyl aminopeptidase family protein [Bauldia sp.]